MTTVALSTGPAVHVSRVRSTWLRELLWLLAAAAVGFGITALFSTALRLPRPWFLAAYLVVASGFLYGYARSSRIDLRQLFRRHRLRGLVGAVLIGAVMA